MKVQPFKNATAYRVTPGYKINPEFLARRPARECGKFEARTDGFREPCGHSTRGLVHDIGGVSLICFQTEERLLPGSVVADAVLDRIEQITEAQGFAPGRKQVREIKERVIEELLPQAFTQSKATLAAFVGDYFIIDTSSAARAEAIIEAMRSAIDELPLSLIHTEKSPGYAMREWLLGDTPWGFTVDNAAVLEGADESKPTVTYQRIDLDSDEIRARIADGFLPRKVAVTIGERVSLQVSDALGLSRIQPAGLLSVEVEEKQTNAEDAQAEFDGSMLLMVSEVARVLDYLVQAFGGFKAPEADLVTEAEGE